MGKVFGLLNLVRVLVLAAEAHRGHEDTRLKKFEKYAHYGAARSTLCHQNQDRDKGCAYNFTGQDIELLQSEQ